MLNRLGAVGSSETLERYIMTISAQHKQEGLLKGLLSIFFTIATTENIDFLQSNASVYSGKSAP